MKRAIENGKLTTDLDAAFNVIRNLGSLVPPPPDLVQTDDSRLSDPRPVIDGSVDNFKVNDAAGITQGKLDLNGDLPSNFLGTTSTTAAQGDLVQPISAKDQVNGYPSLDNDGQLPSGSTPTSGTGTLHEIDFEFPVGEVATVPDTTTSNKIFTGYWAAQDAETIFGNFSGDTAAPTFSVQVLPEALIPDFDASRIISGTFSTDQLPFAVGVGVDHAAGLPPLPGDNNVDGSQQPDDYLGRDMEYHAMKPVVNYQPNLPSPSITIQSYFGLGAYVNITASVDGSTIFYKTSTGEDVFREIGPHEPAFTPPPNTLPILVQIGVTVSAYIAHAGWNNSEISTLVVPPNPVGEPTPLPPPNP